MKVRLIGWALAGLTLTAAPETVLASGGPVCVRGGTAMVAAFHPRAVHMYRRKDARWEHTQMLTSDVTYTYNGETFPIVFGEDVDLDGDTAVVGAPGGTGSVFVYRWRDQKWELEQRIQCEDPEEGQRGLFGSAVAIGGDTLVIGNCEMHDPDQETTHAYVYIRKGTKWTLQQRLENEGARPYHHFGLSVDVEGDIAVIGARDDRDPETYAKYSKRTLGSASIFRRTGETWKREQKLWAPASVLRFGQSVALSGKRLVVGTLAYLDESLFVYRQGDSGWQLEEVLRKHDPKAKNTNFGFSADFDGTTIAVDAHAGDFATIFTRTDGTWGFGLTFVPVPQIPQTGVVQGFVSVDGDTLLVSSVRRESSDRSTPDRKAEVVVYTRDDQGWQRTQDLEPSPPPNE